MFYVINSELITFKYTIVVVSLLPLDYIPSIPFPTASSSKNNDLRDHKIIRGKLTLAFLPVGSEPQESQTGTGHGSFGDNDQD